VAQQVADIFPPTITSVSWTAVASAGSSVAATTGSGNILTSVTLLPGGTVTFIAVAQVSSAADLHHHRQQRRAERRYRRHADRPLAGRRHRR
jgi:hypothetical protein